MATKATHTGTCQVCGSGQLLPGGVLSLHGYTVEWNFFNGVCPGAKHLPFEVDKSLIEGAIARAQHALAAERHEARELRKSPLVGEADHFPAWVSIFRPSTWDRRRSGYEWHKVELLAEVIPYSSGTGSYLKITYLNPLTQKNAFVEHYDTKKTLAETVLHLNGRKAKEVHDQNAKQLTNYISWQESRIVNWEPTALTPRKEGK